MSNVYVVKYGIPKDVNNNQLLVMFVGNVAGAVTLCGIIINNT